VVLKPVILATWEAEFGRIIIWGQPWQKVFEDDMCLSSQLHGEAQIEESWSRLAWA
jgi:hypothetical protein